MTTHHKLDTDTSVFFYEQEFYVLSNFSSFAIEWKNIVFPTLEHAYHWEKFSSDLAEGSMLACEQIRYARSAHDAFQTAQRYETRRRSDWDKVKTYIMLQLLREKVKQHEYVKRKLLETGTRELIEDSWRDSFWGWGADGEGQNVLGKLWMQVRAEIVGAGLRADI